MIISVTGPRPEKLGIGYSQEGFLKLVSFAKQELEVLKPEVLISGMAQGVDQSFAVAALELNIPVVAAIPFDNQDRIWPQESKKVYQNILSHKLIEKHVVNPGMFQPWKFQKRNEWMVNNCDAVLCLYSGASGGTRNCIEYANKIGKPVINVWDKWEKYDKENH